MNTNTLKSFAKAARIHLLDAVGKQVIYWGFSAKGEVLDEPSAIQGGFTHRGEIYNDTTVLAKWERLKDKVTADKEAFKDVAEEAAYTWFNRLVAIKVLEENGFIEPFLQFALGSQTPIALQNAKAGNHQVMHSVLKTNLQKALLDNNEETAFGILLINFCNNHPLLKQVFGRVDDYTEILIPQNLLAHDGVLQALNDDNQISAADFKEVELIGWLYQFYISDKKDEVFKGFKANKKARPEDIPAATQIFTPKWIVNYMVENTVGKIYLDFEEDSDLKKQMKYLVENETDGNGALIEDIEQLTLIDPACGSGHILVTGFEWLYKMYREQGYTAKNAIESILKHNLFGLDIDDRAMQLARFAVLLKAAQQLQQVDASQAIALMNNPLDVIPHIYAFPEKSFFTTEDVALFTNNQHVAEIHTVFESLREGKNIGSALKIILSDAAREVLITQYEDWNAKAKLGTLDFEQQAVFSTLKNYIEVALVLSKRYAAVVANPPYMGQKSMNAQLKTYLDRNYPNSKSDLFAVFMEKMMDMVQDNARIGCITMESWMFLSSYEKLRKSIIEKYSIVGLGHFGWHILGIAFGTAMLILEKSKKITIGEYSYLTIDDVDREENVPFVFPKKDNGRFARIPQTNFDKIPGSPIAYWVSERVREIFRNEILSNINKPRQGIATSNNDYFLKLWFEVSFDKIGISKIKDDSNEKWYPYNKGGESRKWYGNDYYVLNYENDGQELKGFSKSVIRNPEFQMLESLTWSLTSSDKFAVRKKEKGYFFDVNGMSLFPSDDQYYLLGLLNSKYAFNILKLLNPTMAFQVGDISRIPVIYQKNQKLSFFSSENVQITKKDWDSRETSWDFDTNPLLGQQQNNLAAAYEAWVAEVSQGYFQLHANEEELNRIFIDIYGLQDELTPEVALKDITILQDELKADDLEAIEPAFRAGEMVTLPIQQNVVMQQLLSYLVGTMLGRYRLDKASLHIAHPNPTEEELAAYQVENVALPFQMEIDEDAIIPLMGSACAFPDDAVKRVDNLLHRIWGDESHTENLNFLNQCLGIDYEKWITEQFWAYHISGTMYKKKPIYWLFCSNPKSPQKSAFRVLVYMHRMDAYTVQKILRNYLHPHIEYVKGQYEEMQQNELNLSKQELKVFDNMAKQISELKVYEQVLKELANQQITFNLDDGVTVNYAKFEGAVAVIK